MAGFEKHREELASLGVKTVAASADTLDKAQEVARETAFPIAYGVTRELADTLGAWWEPRRGIVQPAEFIVGADRKIIASSYSSGPLGRIAAADAVRLVRAREAQGRT